MVSLGLLFEHEQFFQAHPNNCSLKILPRLNGMIIYNRLGKIAIHYLDQNSFL